MGSVCLGIDAIYRKEKLSAQIHARPGYITMKTYVVLRRKFSANRDEPNVEVLDVKLTQAAAQSLVDANAGTWFEKIVADKRTILTKRG